MLGAIAAGLRICAEMFTKARSHTRGGASRNVGRILFISFGNLARLSENQTSTPLWMGISSITIRWAMCAEGRNAIVESLGLRGSETGVMSRFATMAACVASAIFGSPVAPEVVYRIAGSAAVNSD